MLAESKDDFIEKMESRMKRKQIPFSSSSSHLGTLKTFQDFFSKFFF